MVMPYLGAGVAFWHMFSLVILEHLWPAVPLCHVLVLNVPDSKRRSRPLSTSQTQLFL